MAAGGTGSSAGLGVADAVAAVLGSPAVSAAEVPTGELADRMRRLVAARAALDAALVEQLAVFDTRAGAGCDGQTSTRAWLRSRLRLGGQAGDLVTMARQLDRLPQTAKVFAAGEIGLEHAAEIARLVGQVGAGPLRQYEPILLDLARQAPPSVLRRACEHLRQLLDPDGGELAGARQRRARYLSAARTVGGMVHLQGLLDAAAGDVVLAALAAAMPVPAQSDERGAGQRRADALVDICAGWLAAGQAPAHGGIRPQVQVTVSLETLRQRPGPDWTQPADRPVSDPVGSPADQPVSDSAARPSPPAAQRPTRPAPPAIAGAGRGGLLGDVAVLADGQPIPAGQARRLACDAAVIPVVLGSGSEPLDIGRQSRVVPTGLRRALHLRDGGCRFAGCDRPAGATPTTCGTGPTADPPPWTTPRCSADGTTPCSTKDGQSPATPKRSYDSTAPTGPGST